MDMTTDMVDYDSGVGLRWQSSALLALQEATEAYLVHLFEDACVVQMFFYDCVTKRDFSLVIYARYTQSESRLCREIYNLPVGYEVHGEAWHNLSLTPFSFSSLCFMMIYTLVFISCFNVLYYIRTPFLASFSIPFR